MEDYKEVLDVIEKNYLIEDFLFLLGDSKENRNKIIESFLDYPNPFVRNAAISNLDYEKCSVAAKKKLIELLEDEDETVKISAIEALVDMEAWNVTEDIYKLLDDNDNLVRSYAIWGLGELGGKNHENKLIDIYEEEVDILAKAALCETLYKFTKEEEYIICIKKLLEESIDEEESCFISNSIVGIVEFDMEVKETLRNAIVVKLEETETHEIRQHLEKNIDLLK